MTKTLECISNFVAKCELAPFGCDLISTATWKGARLADVINLAGGLKPGVVALAAIAADEFTTALPIEAAMDPNTLLVYEMNGQPLPREHGYPARILVRAATASRTPSGSSRCGRCAREFVDWYGQRNWSKLGQVKTMTRIDMPAPNAVLPPGDHRLAGIAYAGDRGIAKVEYTVDGGKSWRAAELLDPSGPGKDTWVRWEGKVTLAPGGRADGRLARDRRRRARSSPRSSRSRSRTAAAAGTRSSSRPRPAESSSWPAAPATGQCSPGPCPAHLGRPHPLPLPEGEGAHAGARRPGRVAGRARTRSPTAAAARDRRPRPHRSPAVPPARVRTAAEPVPTRPATKRHRSSLSLWDEGQREGAPDGRPGGVVGQRLASTGSYS